MLGTDFCGALDRSGFSRWFLSCAGEDAALDPWASFEAARRDVGQGGTLRILIDLFVRHEPVNELEVVRSLGAPLMAWLHNQGILVAGPDEGIVSECCLISGFGHCFFVDWPHRTRTGHLSCQRTYLSSGTYDCARWLARLEHAEDAIDLGSGTGMLAVLLRRITSSVTAIDIDARATFLTKANALMNSVKVSVRHESWKSLSQKGMQYQLAVANPPWRIVPPGIVYPDAVARVGLGKGGLRQVGEVLSILSNILRPGGQAVVRFDLPMDKRGNPAAGFDLQRAIGPNCRYELEKLGVVSVDEQSQTSSENCAHLNQDCPDLCGVFRRHYAHLGVSSLERVLCVVSKRMH